MTKTLILKNKYLIFLVNYLSTFNLAGNDSRERSRFVELLKERAVEIETERIKILEKHADKNEKGEYIKNKVQKRDANDNLTITEEYRLANENIEKYQNDYDEYMEEDFIIDILEGNKSKIKKVKELLLNSTLPVKEIEATYYNEICEIFEKLEFKK